MIFQRKGAEGTLKLLIAFLLGSFGLSVCEKENYKRSKSSPGTVWFLAPRFSWFASLEKFKFIKGTWELWTMEINFLGWLSLLHNGASSDLDYFLVFRQKQVTRLRVLRAVAKDANKSWKNSLGTTYFFTMASFTFPHHPSLTFHCY